MNNLSVSFVCSLPCLDITYANLARHNRICSMQWWAGAGAGAGEPIIGLEFGA